MDSEFYKMNSTPKGVALIFCHNTFGNSRGVEKDAQRFKETLNELGFEVRHFNNKTKEDIECITRKVAAEDHALRDCLVVVVLTASGPGDKLRARDGVYSENLFKEVFDDCTTLRQKPKIYFIQALSENAGDETIVADSAQPQGPRFADILTCCCKYDAQPPALYDERGSLFSQELCKELISSGRSKDITRLLPNVFRKIGERSHDLNANWPQRKVYFSSSLTRPLKFDV